MALTERRLKLAALVTAVAVAACGGSGNGDASPATTSAPASTASTTTTTPAAGVVDGRPYAVERSELIVEDRTRPTDADPDRGLDELPSRTLPVMVLTPQGPGPFPVLVFAHGVTASGPVYEPFLTQVAAAGYVVAAPTFPLSSGPNGEIFDYVNQPGDMYAVLDEVVARGGATVDGDLVALAGHSLGAMTTIGAVYHSCCADPRVDAAVAIAGVEAPFPDGSFDPRPATPLLLLHGDVDPTIAVDASDRLFAAAAGPVAFLRFPAGAHSDILFGEAGELSAQAMVAWLDRWLLDDPSGWQALAPAVESSGVAGLTER